MLKFEFFDSMEYENYYIVRERLVEGSSKNVVKERGFWKVLWKMNDLKEKGMNLEKEEKGILGKMDSLENRNNLICLGK